MAFIEIRNLHRAYRTLDGARVGKPQIVFSGLSLDVEEGEMVAVVGPSGCGKSALLRMVGGLDSVDKRVTERLDGHKVNLVEGGGEITIGSFPISRADGDEKADFINRHIGFVFQAHHLIAELTALENVALPMMIRRVSRRDAEAVALEMLAKVELEEHAAKHPPVLSGGEKQRVAIARALVNRPRVILADEPTGSLDPKLKASIFDLLRRLNREEGITIILVTHDTELLYDRAGRPKTDRVITLAEARSQPPAEPEPIPATDSHPEE